MVHLREEMAKTQKLQTREQQALAEWQAGVEASSGGWEGPARPQGTAGPPKPVDCRGR